MLPGRKDWQRATRLHPSVVKAKQVKKPKARRRKMRKRKLKVLTPAEKVSVDIYKNKVPNDKKIRGRQSIAPSMRGCWSVSS